MVGMIRLPGDDDGGAGTVHLGEIAVGGHAYLEPWPLATNDWTISIGLEKCGMKAASSGTTAVTGFAKLAGAASLGKCSYLIEGCGVQNVQALGEQV